MRILIISNFYPPNEVGGWEQNSQELAEIFRHDRHTVQVLTSTYGAPVSPPDERGVYRLLALESDVSYYNVREFFLKWRANVRKNQAHLSQRVSSLRPDIIFIHCMWNLAPAIAWSAEQLCPGRVVYQMFGDWPHAPSVHEQFWRQPARRWYMRLPRRLLGTIAMRWLASVPMVCQLEFHHVLAVSHAIRQELIEKTLITPEDIHVICNGIDAAPFLDHSRLARPISRDGPIKLLYAGNLFEHKGVHTLVQAFAILNAESKNGRAELTILGSGHPDYERRLHEMVERGGLKVTFRPKVPRSQIASILGEHDIFVLPSLYEPLARMLQEAMATGLAVVGTDAWGTREALKDGVNGLLFTPGYADQLAAQLNRLIDDPELRRRLGTAAQQTVLEYFTLERMAKDTEAYLEKVVLGSPASFAT